MSREEVRHMRRSAPAASVRGWEMCGCVKLLLESSGSSRRRLFEAFFFFRCQGHDECLLRRSC